MLDYVFLNGNRKDNRWFKSQRGRISMSSEKDAILISICRVPAFVKSGRSDEMRIFLILERCFSDLLFKGRFQL